MGHKLTLNRTTRDSGECYATALAEACQQAGGVDPVKVLTDTEDYPQVTREIEMAEFLVGWFHGVSEALGTLPETLWDAVAPAAPEPPKPRKKRKPKAKAPAKPRKPKAKAPAKPAPAPVPAPVEPPATDAKAIDDALAGLADEDKAAKAKAMIEALRKRREAVRQGVSA
ncbi:MAG: hypothetical protein KJO40_13625 [Deltaproteobacteria bacterium]|nr:hypothetical protein [Deltaproteobacteria bacterium]